jgi:hypothetical protein
MAKITIGINEQDRARTEAAIYAEGTPFTVDELFVQWVSACQSSGELVNPQTVYEYELRNHPQFEESWMA